MAFSLTFPFDNPDNYTKDQTEVSGGFGLLELTSDPNNSFVVDFANDTGYTYDSAKAEFVAGQVQQKDQTPSNSIFGGNFTSSMNLSWHKELAVTATLNGTPTLSGGKIVCSGAQGVYWNNNTKALESHKFIYTPGYTTSPGSNVNMLSGYNGTNNNDRFHLTHSPSGNTLRMTLFDNVGASVVSVLAIGAAWTPTAGVDYEFELGIDPASGVIRVFIDGTLHGTLSPGAWTRGTSASRFYLGACPIFYDLADGSFDDYLMFDNIQHTGNYVPGYTVVDNIYAETTVTTPELEYTGVGTIVSFDTFNTTETATPRYTIQISRSGIYLYWNGTAWVASDGSYAESTDAATFDANSGSLPVLGEIYGQFKVHFPDSNTQSAVDELEAILTTQQYYTSGTIITQEIQAEALDSFAAVEVNTANTNISYAIYVDGTLKYHDGAAWVNSNGLAAQTNTAAEINTNASSLVSTNSTLKIYILITTTNQQETGKIDSITIEYDFGGVVDAPETCLIWGYYRDISGNAVSGATVSFRLVRNSSEYKEAANNIIEQSVSTTTRSDGYFEIALIRSSEYEGTAGTYYLSITKSSANLSTSKDNDGVNLEITVPDAISKDITELLTAA